jgi:hypothetical protein
MRAWLWVGLIVTACQGSGDAVVPQYAAQEQQERVFVYEEQFYTLTPLFAPVAGGIWTANDEKLTLRNPASAYPNGNIILTHRSVEGDFRASSRFSTSAGPGWNDCSVVFAYRGPDDYWFASFNEGNDAETNGLFRWRNGSIVEVADFVQTTPENTGARVVIERTGSTVRVSRNEVVIAEATDPSLADGRVGFGSRNDACDFGPLYIDVPRSSQGNFWVDILEKPGTVHTGIAWITAAAARAERVEALRPSGEPLYDVDHDGAVIDTIAAGPTGRIDYKLRAHHADGRVMETPVSHIVAANECTTVVPGTSLQRPIGPYNRTFMVRFHAVAGAGSMDGGFALGQGPMRYFAQGSAITRFAPTGFMDARDADVYRVAYEPVPFVAGRTYEIEFSVDPGTQRYSSAALRADGGPWVASGFQFRSTRMVSTIDNFSTIVDPESAGPMTICNLRTF